MTDALGQMANLLALGHSIATAAALVFLRIGATLALLPAFGEHSVPQRLRLVIALAFTAVVLPVVASGMPTDPGPIEAGAEIVTGLMIGAVFRMFILALQIAGTMIAQATSLSQIAGGASAEPQPAIGQLLTVAGLAIAVMAGLHVRVAEALILSYEALPVGRFLTSADVAEWGVVHFAQAFRLAFTLAAPFTIASMMYNLALGAINRAMPALMVSFIGAPALSAAGLAMLAILAPLLLGTWSASLSDFLDAPFEVPN